MKISIFYRPREQLLPAPKGERIKQGSSQPNIAGEGGEKISGVAKYLSSFFLI